MKNVKTVKNETNAFHPHKHMGPSQNMDWKCKKLTQKMEKQEYKDEYAKRAGVEGICGYCNNNSK